MYIYTYIRRDNDSLGYEMSVLSTVGQNMFDKGVSDVTTHDSMHSRIRGFHLCKRGRYSKLENMNILIRE